MILHNMVFTVIAERREQISFRMDIGLYRYRTYGTHTRVFSRTLAHINSSKLEIRQKNRGRRQLIWYRELVGVDNWLKTNILSLNVSKTSFIIISNQKKTFDIKIRESVLTKVPTVKLNGVKRDYFFLMIL